MIFHDSTEYQLASLSGPLGALLLGGVALRDVLALLLLDRLALHDVVLHVVLVVSGLALCIRGVPFETFPMRNP